MADENHLALIYCFKDTSTAEYLFIEPHYIIIVVPVSKQKCIQKHIPKNNTDQKTDRYTRRLLFLTKIYMEARRTLSWNCRSSQLQGISRSHIPVTRKT